MKKNNKYGSITIITVVAIIVVGIAVYAVSKSNWAINKSVTEQTSNTDAKNNSADSSKYATLKGDAFDEAYIADMLAHHEGAISMSEMAGASSDRKEILDLSQNIMQSQSEELVKMQAWQAEWGYEKTMGGHGSHSGMGNEMSGTMMDMSKELEALKGSDFDKKFLELMIEHHQQAVDMSQYADANAKHQETKELAKQIIDAQQAEIAQMQKWQMEWGYTAVESGDSMPGMDH